MTLMRDQSLVQDTADLMPDTITVAPFASRDFHNQDTPGAAVSYAVYIEGKTRVVRNPKGEDVTSNVAIYGLTGLSTDDKITLPSRFNPRTPPIINIDRKTDEFGVAYEVVYL